MKQIYYGQIDLTKIGQIAQGHKELIKNVQFKDGEHKLLNIALFLKEEPDKYGNIACVKAACKLEDQKPTVNYFIGDMKETKPRETKPNSGTELPPTYSDDLGFSW